MKKILLFFCSFLVLTLLSAQNLDSMQQLYYPFSGNANDASGNNYHGTVSGATLTTDRFGNPNSAYYFNGVNSFIDLPNVPALKPPLPLTIAFWVKFENFNWTKSFLLDTDFEQNNYTGIHVNVIPNWTVEFSYGGGAGNTSTSNRRSKRGTTSLQINTWYHVVGIVRGPLDMDIYINCVNDNGTYDGTGGPMSYSNYHGTIGRVDSDMSGPPHYLQGTLDEFRYWNRALTPAEVQMLCNLMANAGSHQTICSGQSVTIGGSPSAQNGAAPYTYAWSPSTGLSDPTVSNPVAAPTTSTTYTLTVTDNFNVSATTSVTILVEDCSGHINDFFIPNIFSPNNDQLNDVLYVRGEGIVGLEFLVFNRWGEKIFESANINHGWDGTYKGRMCDPGVYTYMAKVTFVTQQTIEKSGTITLVR